MRTIASSSCPFSPSPICPAIPRPPLLPYRTFLQTMSHVGQKGALYFSALPHLFICFSINLSIRQSSDIRRLHFKLGPIPNHPTIDNQQSTFDSQQQLPWTPKNITRCLPLPLPLR